jgi:hypothetical protein
MPALGVDGRSVEGGGVRRRGSEEGFGGGVWRRRGRL